MAPLTSSTRGSGADQQSTGATSTGRRSSGGRLRKLIVWGGLLAAGYVVARRARSGDLPKSTDGIREKAGEALPGEGQTIPIGDTGEESGDSGSDDYGSDESGSDDYTAGGRASEDTEDETIGTGPTGGEPTSSAAGSEYDETDSAGVTTGSGSDEDTDSAVSSADDQDEDDE